MSVAPSSQDAVIPDPDSDLGEYHLRPLRRCQDDEVDYRDE
jgi:hypothetical protein